MQLLEQNIKLKMTKVKDFVYQVSLPVPQSDVYKGLNIPHIISLSIGNYLTSD